MSVELVPVAELDELSELEMKVVRVANRHLIVTMIDGQMVAFERDCPDAGVGLETGVIIEGRVYCPAHNWAFDIRTGVCTQPWRGPSLETLPVERHDGKWCVRLEH